MSVHFWGENPNGIWHIKVVDNSDKFEGEQKSNKHRTRGANKFLSYAKLMLHGTETDPQSDLTAEKIAEITAGENFEDLGQNDSFENGDISSMAGQDQENPETSSSFIQETSKLIHHSETCLNDMTLTDFLNYQARYECHDYCDKNFGCCGPTQGDCFKCEYATYTTGTRCLRECPNEMYLDENGICQLCKPQLGSWEES